MMKQRILIVDDDPDILDVIRITLESEGFDVTEAHDGEDGLEKVLKRPPDLAIFDYKMPRKDGVDVCRILKKDILLRHVPIILLTGKGETSDKVTGLEAGADDYMVKPFEPEELVARVKTILRRTGIALDANPLTRLPGNVSILNEIEERIADGSVFAVCYADLDKFKSYNDKYGFERGDDVIRSTARIIIQAAKTYGKPGDFIGHIGGDDFVIISTPETAEPICAYIVKEFAAIAASFYNDEDRARGYIVGKDRQGNEHHIQIISISIGIVTNKNRPINHVAEIGEVGAELKQYAKSKPGSVYVQDQRKG